MTDAQEYAFTEIERMMREHFEAAILVVECDHSDKDSECRATWNGGYASAIGLLEIGKQQVGSTAA